MRLTKPSNDQEALQALVTIIIAQDYSISVNDGGDWPVKRSTDIPEICEAASAVSEALLRLRGGDGATAGMIDLVFGNAPDELISDHTDNPAMTAIFDEFQRCFSRE
ncbi:hypothetical protein CCR94_18180 [Rhodoblastus sphagnicola]|uniref:Uncharacterized protein n=1 Tax=Rhodoblastus sphagnicola TaxID=333368 RepID=A0A2S6N0S1_9HYPH|nr:hypothetical protein [Rhodoblastus sphagnicola]MBB4200583.1 hypothetical protein [Rhodoblastus sphagnicola]PPQ28227.1 hypothetical protein CCR94_18180 [Rhodoblastus sphagnicola]